MNKKELTRYLDETAAMEGAALLGLAPVERFITLPVECGPKPQDVYPAAKTAISIAVQMPDACMERAGFHDYGDPEGGHVNVSVSMRLNHIACKLSRILEKQGHAAFPVSATIVWRYRPYKQFPTPFLGDVSHRHMAVGAGLGEFGWNGLLMTKDYGPRVRLATVITDAELIPTPMYDGPQLCDKCMRCVKACQKNIQGLTKEVNGVVKITIGGKTCEYANKNLWRCAWTENFAIQYDAPKPDQINEQTMKDVFRDITRNHPEYLKTWSVEPCWGECLPAHIRRMDENYCNVPRRIKEDRFAGVNNEQILKTVQEDLLKSLEKRFSTFTLRFIRLADKAEVREILRRYLPDIQSLVLVKVPILGDDAFVQKRQWYHVLSAELDMITYLDRKGYSALQLSFLREKQYESELAEALKALDLMKETTEFKEEQRKLVEFLLSNTKFIEGDEYMLGLAGTSLELPDTEYFQTSADVLSEHPDGRMDAAGIKELAGRLGVDKVGISSAERLEDVSNQLRTIYRGKQCFDAVDKNSGKGPYIPEVNVRDMQVKSPSDYLEDAASVIVVGMGLSREILRLKQDSPAEVIGPYAAHRFFLLDELAEKAMKLADAIRANGFRAVPVYDFNGVASTSPFPIREQHPDARSSGFAAVAAGLGELGLHGMVLTGENGVANIFMSIVTNMPLSPDPLYDSPRLCKQCGKCVESCPADALCSQSVNTIKIEDKEFTWAEFRHNHCDWAKKYALMGEEGPAYAGSLTNCPPPERITKERLADALSNTDEIQKDYFLIMEPCLIACQASKNLTGDQHELS